MVRSSSNLVWIDLETTGLDVGTRVILEIATIVTDKNLEIVDQGPVIVIHYPDEILSRIDPWCREQHAQSGLLTASRNSKVDLEAAQQATVEFLKTHCPSGKCPLCGNSICFDRRFLIAHMPKVDRWLNYRNVDVSSIKELVHRWRPEALVQIEKESTHRALSDILESIEELRYYRRILFEPPHG